jgi:hypothetical protein
MRPDPAGSNGWKNKIRHTCAGVPDFQWLEEFIPNLGK